jgi:hypothetical protein
MEMSTYYIIISIDKYEKDEQLYGPYDDEEMKIIKQCRNYENYTCIILNSINIIDNHKVEESLCCCHKRSNKYYGPFLDMKSTCEWLLLQDNCNDYHIYDLICLNRDKIGESERFYP